MQISDLFCTCFSFTLMHCGFCSCTLQALCAGIVHCPADQRHCDAQQNKEDPVFSQPGHKESLHPCYAVWQNTIKAHKRRSNKASIYLFFSVSSELLTSTLGVGAFLLHRGRKVGFSCLLISSLCLHVGLLPVPLSAVIAVLMSVSTVVPILTMAAMSMSCPPMATWRVAMFLDLSLCQQACGLPSAGASLVLLVFPIELSINQETKPLIK